MVGQGVTYSSLERHFCLVEAQAGARTAKLAMRLIDKDGRGAYAKRFELPRA